MNKEMDNSHLELEKLRKENEQLRKALKTMPFAFTYNHQTRGRTNNALKAASELLPIERLEEFIAPIFDLIPHHIVFIDTDGILTICNDRAAIDHGEKPGTMTGRHIRDLIKIPDEKILILQSLQQEKELTNKEVLDRNYYSVSTKFIRNLDGSIKRVVGVFFYLKSIKEAEKQAIAGRIAAGIAHEIRNPLTTVRGYLQLLQSKADTETAELFSELLIPEIDRANHIISDFLTIAKPVQKNRIKLSLTEFLYEYLSTFLQTQSSLYDIDLTVQADPGLEEAFFTINREEILQVFLNLLQNSLQAQADTRLKISITAHRRNGYLLFQFQDNGQGIPTGVLTNIFDPFFSTKDTGTGLGLSVSKKIIENHNGFITADSSPAGTVFQIELPEDQN